MVESSRNDQTLAKRLGRNIARCRKARGLTQAALAEQLGIEPESVSRCERGATLPSLASLEQFASVLGATIADLLAEYPSEAYPEAQRLSGMLSTISPEARSVVLEMVEKLCALLRKA